MLVAINRFIHRGSGLVTGYAGSFIITKGKIRTEDNQMNTNVIYFICSFCILPSIYFILSLYFRRYEHIRTKNGTPLNVFLTYQVTNTIAVIYLGITGIIFYIYQEIHSYSVVNPPLYLRFELLERLLIYPMIFYQFHSIVLFLLVPIPELGSAFMFIHHLTTLLLGVFSIYPQPV